MSIFKHFDQLKLFFKTYEVEFIIFFLFFSPLWRLIIKFDFSFTYKILIVLIVGILFHYLKNEILRWIFNSLIFQFFLFCLLYVENLFFSSFLLSLSVGYGSIFLIPQDSKNLIYIFFLIGVFLSFITRFKFLVLNPFYTDGGNCLKSLNDFNWNWVISCLSAFTKKHYCFEVKNFIPFDTKDFSFANASRSYMFGDDLGLLDDSLKRKIENLETFRTFCLISGFLSFCAGFCASLVQRYLIVLQKEAELELQRKEIIAGRQELESIKKELDSLIQKSD